jgi:tRNA pseudouridine38-40 synthase
LGQIRYKLTIAYDGTHFLGWQKQEPYADAALEREAKGAALAPDKRPTRAAMEAAAHPDAPPRIVETLGVREGEERARVAMRTVQHVVEQAVRRTVREPVTLDGASRTDSGVHARGQCGAFTCGDGINPDGSASHTGWPAARGVETLARAINANLPPDVLVTRAEVVPLVFNPISDATSKAYSYTLHVGRTRPLFERDFVTWVYDALDVEAMRRAAGYLVGTHDFTSFAAVHHGRATTVRTVSACNVREVESKEGTKAPGIEASSPSRRIVIDIASNGFLYNMVRIVAGTLVEVGRGRVRPDAMAGIIEGSDRRLAGPTMPPEGLCLEWIRYGEAQSAEHQTSAEES